MIRVAAIGRKVILIACLHLPRPNLGHLQPFYLCLLWVLVQVYQNPIEHKSRTLWRGRQGRYPSLECSKRLHSQTARAWQLKLWENVTRYMSCVTCHLSCVKCHMPFFFFKGVEHVTCHVSHVTCQMSCVTCHMSCVKCHMQFFYIQRRGANQCYQQGLPSLYCTLYSLYLLYYTLYCTLYCTLHWTL